MNYMTFGYWLLPSVITFFYFSIVGRSKIYLFLSLISFFVLFSFGSRFSLVIAISSLFVFDNLNSNFNFKKIAFLIFGGLVAFVFYLNILTIVTILLNILEPLGIAPTSLYRLLKMASDTSGSIIASSERESLYHLSLNLIGDNPFGYSILGYSNLLDSTSIFKYPHNIFIQLILEKGIILSTFITCAWFIIYKRAMRVFSYGDRFFLVMLTLISTKLLVSSNYLWEPAFWILCGCLVKSMSMRGSNGEDSIIFNR
ncbi:O-antigen ligase family protein [Marinomonas gallaica]|uniref:O-antigen ligase family protein n=1 Tax=Marinomonas gallaica TaxID=1806667 RepID=UPI003A934A8D